MRANVLSSEIAGLGLMSPSNPVCRAYMRAAHLPAPVLCEHDYGPLTAYCDGLPEVPAFRQCNPADKWLADWDDNADGAALAGLFEPDPGLEDEDDAGNLNPEGQP